MAHEDIQVASDWGLELIKVLRAGDVCLALLTENFHDSEWTDQEIGIAVGCNIPIVLINIGLAPYGFMERLQSLTWTGKQVPQIAEKIVDLLIEKKETRARMAESLTIKLETLNDQSHWTLTLHCLDLLEKCPSIAPPLLDRIEAAFAERLHSPSVAHEVSFFHFKARLATLLKRHRLT